VLGDDRLHRGERLELVHEREQALRNRYGYTHGINLPFTTKCKSQQK